MRRKDKGSAMIVVLCIMAITMVLSFALLLSVSMVVANTNRRKTQEQCKISASSFSKIIEEDLKDTAYNEKDGSYRAYLRDQIESYQNNASTGWTYYNEEEGDAHSMAIAKRTFEVTKGDAVARTGAISIEGYWESDSKFSTVSFVYTVIARKGNESYRQQIRYQLEKLTPSQYHAEYPDKGIPSKDVWLWRREGIQ